MKHPEHTYGGFVPAISERGTTTHPFQSYWRDGSLSLLPHHAERIDIVDVWVQFPLILSGTLRGLDGEKAEVPSMPHTIPGVGSERPLRLSQWYKLRVPNRLPCSFDL
jgi:hypothetical protein